MLTGTIHRYSGRALGLVVAGAAALSLGVFFASTPATAQKDYVVLSDVEGFDAEAIRYATPSDLADENLLIDVARSNGRIFAVGEFGHIIYSEDKGETWTQAEEVQTQVTLTTVAFPSKDVGFAAGHDATILRTTDGGHTWERVYHDFEAETPIFGLHFITPEHGFAAGAFSFLLETKDGGNTWTQRDISDEGAETGGYDYHLNEIFATKSGTIYLPAEFGNVYRSRDEGATFEIVKTPYEGSFWNGLGLDNGSVLVFGMRGNVYRSDNDGESWVKVPTGVQRSFSGGVQLANGNVVLVGLNGAVSYSEDGGRSFTTVSRKDRENYADVADGPEGSIILFGVPGVKHMPDNAKDAISEDDVTS